MTYKYTIPRLLIVIACCLLVLSTSCCTSFTFFPGSPVRHPLRTPMFHVAKNAGSHENDPFSLLSDDITSNILSFVGNGTYRFTADVNKQFRGSYQQEFSNDYRTFSRHGVDSISCAEIFSMEKNSNDMTLAAARYGQLEVLEWALTKHSNTSGENPWSHWLATAAARNGHLHILQWLKDTHVMYWAVGPETCAAAASGGHLDVLQWLLQKGCCPWDEMTMNLAAQHGHIAILQWAQRNGCPPMTEATCTFAAASGRLDVLKWLREEYDCPWDEDTCANAAAQGHLEMLQWAREKQCPWDETTCLRAAARGHLPVLQWARENGCPWNQHQCLKISKTFDVQEWIKNNGY